MEEKERESLGVTQNGDCVYRFGKTIELGLKSTVASTSPSLVVVVVVMVLMTTRHSTSTSQMRFGIFQRFLHS